MDTLLKELFTTSGAVETINVIQVLMATFMSFGLSLVAGYTYRVTHQGPSYSQTTVQTMVLMGVVVSVIMLIIGSNIARAFSLVGALSIIRFRNAVKESRDVAFYFLTTAIGMACGTGFYGVAIVFTLCSGVIVYSMSRFKIGAKPLTEVLLRLTLDATVDYEKAFKGVFYKYLESDDLLSVDGDGTNRLELVYTIRFRKGASEQAFFGEIGKVDQSVHAQLLRNQNNMNL